MSKRVKKKSNVLKQHQEPEDWCFECKDGGEVVVCDQGKCGKVYHPLCIDQDESLSEVTSWVCGWHYCITCRDFAKYFCLGCPNGSLCHNCLDASKFTVIRRRKGLCSGCSELVLIIEQNLEQDSEGNKLSFSDRETYECLFKEYWDIVKNKEKLTSNDVLAALDNSKKGKSIFSESDSSDEGEEPEKLISLDSDEDHTFKRKTNRRKRPNGKESRLSKSSSRGISILDKYRKGNFLSKIDSGEDGEGKEVELISSDSDEDHTCKRKTVQRKRPNGKESRRSKSSSRGKSILKKGLLYMKPSLYASINARNINFVYLKQSLVQELSKQPESFKNKVVGAFVRVKVETNDPRQRSSYHLVKVLGVLNDEISNGFLLHVSSMANAIPISKISDVDFIEEECVELQKKVQSGLLPRSTIAEFQEKANLLHEDITKHWIATRLVYLQNQIDRANLRGRHKEKDELIDEREELKKKSKQEELLRKLPSVSAELLQVEYDDAEDKEETDSESH